MSLCLSERHPNALASMFFAHATFVKPMGSVSASLYENGPSNIPRGRRLEIFIKAMNSGSESSEGVRYSAVLSLMLDVPAA